jgi:hypothetical protein
MCRKASVSIASLPDDLIVSSTIGGDMSSLVWLGQLFASSSKDGPRLDRDMRRRGLSHFVDTDGHCSDAVVEQVKVVLKALDSRRRIDDASRRDESVGLWGCVVDR